MLKLSIFSVSRILEVRLSATVIGQRYKAKDINLSTSSNSPSSLLLDYYLLNYIQLSLHMHMNIKCAPAYTRANTVNF